MVKIKISLVGAIKDRLDGNYPLEYDIQTKGMSHITDLINEVKLKEPRLKDLMDRMEGGVILLVNGKHVDLNDDIDNLPPVCEITVIPQLSGG